MKKVIRWAVLYKGEDLKRDAHAILQATFATKDEIDYENASLVKVTLEVQSCKR